MLSRSLHAFSADKYTHSAPLQELLVAEKGALQLQLSTSQAALHEAEQHLSELTQQHIAIQAELAESLDYQQQIETQISELEMESQAARASFTAEQAQCQRLSQHLSQTQAELAIASNELTHTKTALTQTSDLSRDLQVTQCSLV